MKLGGVAKWLSHRVANPVGSTRVGSNPAFDTTNNKPTDKSAIHSSAVGN